MSTGEFGPGKPILTFVRPRSSHRRGGCALPAPATYETTLAADSMEFRPGEILPPLIRMRVGGRREERRVVGETATYVGLMGSSHTLKRCCLCAIYCGVVDLDLPVAMHALEAGRFVPYQGTCSGSLACCKREDCYWHWHGCYRTFHFFTRTQLSQPFTQVWRFPYCIYLHSARLTSGQLCTHG